eukprot:365575-Chlamydomonas_euryale.AAC.5
MSRIHRRKGGCSIFSDHWCSMRGSYYCQAAAHRHKFKWTRPKTRATIDQSESRAATSFSGGQIERGVCAYRAVTRATTSSWITPISTLARRSWARC